LNGADTTALMLEHNNSYMVGVVVDVLCVRLFDPDEEQRVFLNEGYIGGTGKMSCFFPVSIEEIY
jgi:hypothetical protein